MPKVTMEEFKKRIAESKGLGNVGNSDDNNASANPSSQPSISINGGSNIPSGNPLHPDVREQLQRLTEEVRVLKRQIYGGQLETGMAAHVQDHDDMLKDYANRLSQVESDWRELVLRQSKFESDFKDLLRLLEIEEDAPA